MFKLNLTVPTAAYILNSAASRVETELLFLFANGGAGVWLDPSDLPTLFQDSAGTIPVTGGGEPVGLVMDKSPNGDNGSQAVAAAQPTYMFEDGIHYLSQDMVDDNLDIDFGKPFEGTVVQGTPNGVLRYKINVPDGKWKLTQEPGYVPDGGKTISLVAIEGDMSNDDFGRVKAYMRQKGAGEDFAGSVSLNEWFVFRTDIVGIDTSYWDTSNVTSMSNTFYGMSSITSPPDVSGWDTSNVTSMIGTFQNMSSLTTPPDVSNWDTSNVTSMNGTFNSRSAGVVWMDVSNWNTSNVTSLNTIFFSMSSVSLPPDVSGWNASNVTSMNGTFSGMSSLTTPPDVSNWNTSNVTNLNTTFRGMTSLTTPPDVSNWDVSSVTTASLFATDTPWDTPSYDAMLAGWGSQTVKSGVRLAIPLAKYTAGGAAEAGRDSLIAQGWTINDGGPVV